MPKRTSYKQIITENLLKKKNPQFWFSKAPERNTLYTKSNNTGEYLHYRWRIQDLKQPKPGGGETVGGNGQSSKEPWS